MIIMNLYGTEGEHTTTRPPGWPSQKWCQNEVGDVNSCARFVSEKDGKVA